MGFFAIAQCRQRVHIMTTQPGMRERPSAVWLRYSAGEQPSAALKRAERAEAGVSDEVADFGHGKVRTPEQIAGPFEAPALEVLARCFAVGLAKGPHEVIAGVPGAACQCIKVELLAEGTVHEVPGLTQVDQDRFNAARHRPE